MKNTLKAVVIFFAMLCMISGVLAQEITGLTVFACSDQGVVNDALRFNAGPLDAAWEVYLYEGEVFDPDRGDARKIAWLNDRQAHTIRIPLTEGTHTFTYHHDSPGQAPLFAMNFFLDGQNDQSGLSVFTAVNEAEGNFQLNGAPNTQGWPITSIAGAGTNIYESARGALWTSGMSAGGIRITLTGYRVWTPSEKNLDLVSPTSFEPDGKPEYIGQFTLVVEKYVPQPMDVIFWLRAMADLKVGKDSYGQDWKEQDDIHPVTPFSFQYGDLSSEELFGRCQIKQAAKKLDKNRAAHTVTYSDPETGLELRWEGIAYQDFPTVEWTLYFKNTGSTNTPILSEIYPLKTRMNRGEKGEFTLHGSVGDTCAPTAFQPFTRIMPADDAYAIASAGGRPTSMAFPYFNLECEGEGMIAVLSWPGQWKAQFQRDGGKGMEITAGQELTRFTLYPGEEVRSPRVVLQFWKSGDWIDAQNVWRRWMMAYNMPHPGGKPIPPMNLGSSYRVHQEMTRATEENLIPFINRFIEEGLRIDCWWMDAGWYECEGNWGKTGNWWPDPVRFPRGLKPVCDFAHQHGMKTMVWFEPERVHPGTWLTEKHPQWIHGGASGGLLKLHEPEVLEWLTNHVDQLMKDNGIDNYRQDFNIDPLSFWRGNDAEDRQGMTEIKHVMNYLAYFGELSRRHPDMFIDTCASGGRRMTLDTLRYAVPLWRSDYQYVSDFMQGLTYGISFWIPYHGGGNAACEVGYYGEGSTPVQPYAFWSCCYPAVLFAMDVRAKDMDYAALRDLFKKRDLVTPNYYGDFYPLTPHSLERHVWVAWQFDRPESGEGMVQAFRRTESNILGYQYKLRSLDANASYELKDLATMGTTEVTGKELMEKGVKILIEDQPGAAVILYRKIP